MNKNNISEFVLEEGKKIFDAAKKLIKMERGSWLLSTETRNF